MMTRLQVTLDEETMRVVKERAAALGISTAELLRQMVYRELGEPLPPVDPSLVFGLGDSGGADVARDKDAMLGEALAAEGGLEPAQRTGTEG